VATEGTRYDIVDGGTTIAMNGDAETTEAIGDQAPQNLLSRWIFAVAWNIASFVLVVPLIRAAIHKHNNAGLFYAIVPVVGIGLLLGAIRRTVRARKFGQSSLRLKTSPVKPGGDLSGVIHVSRAIARRGPVTLRLVCVRRERAPKGNSSEHVIWEKRQSLEEIAGSADGVEIPVGFLLPPDAAPSTLWGLGDQILWRLEARCKTTGVSYFSRFEIPVSADSVQQPVAAPVQQVATRGKWTEAGIHCQPTAGRGLNIQAAAGRNKGQAMILAIIGLVFTGIAVTLAILNVPTPMRVVALSMAAVCVFFGGLILLAAVCMWMVRTEVTARHESITVARSVPLFRRQRTVAAADISELKCKSDGSMRLNQKVTIYYGVLMTTRNGRETWLVNGLHEKDYAEWIADGIRTAVGAIGGK
jgi:hypothetical protein